MKKIFYSFPNFASFVQKDREILQQSHKVHSFLFSGSPKWKLPLTFLVQILQLLWHGWQTDIFITQFAGYQSVLPTFFSRLFRKKSVIVLGGTDCNWLPSIRYGNFQKPMLRWATVYSLKKADLLLPVSQELVYSTYTFTKEDGPCQGYQCFFPEITTPMSVIPNGIHPDAFPFSDSLKLPNSFITICSGIEDERRRKVKGIDLILSVAPACQGCQFMLVGGSLEAAMAYQNVDTMSFADQADLPSILGKYQFYMQLSMTEGFPNALIEAMACGCVPIVSNVGAMPSIIGEAGYVLEQKNATLLANLLEKARSEYTPEKALAARKQAALFTIERRAALLQEALGKL